MKLYQLLAALDFQNSPGVLGYMVDPRLFKNLSDAQTACDLLNIEIVDDWDEEEGEYRGGWALSSKPEWEVIELDIDSAI